jgi:hypothetical protein
MKRVTILLVVLTLVLATAAPVAARSDTERPFKGTAAGYGMVQPDGSCPVLPDGAKLRSVFAATGQATHLGKFELDYYNCTPLGSYIEGVEMTFLAANGDKIFATYEAYDVPPAGLDPTLLEITYDFAIIGGTGRFDGATGGGQMMAAIEFQGILGPNDWPTTFAIEGTIAY